MRKNQKNRKNLVQFKRKLQNSFVPGFLCQFEIIPCSLNREIPQKYSIKDENHTVKWILIFLPSDLLTKRRMEQQKNSCRHRTSHYNSIKHIVFLNTILICEI